MSDFSIQEKLIEYKKAHPDVKATEKELISIMVKDGVITNKEAIILFSASASKTEKEGLENFGLKINKNTPKQYTIPVIDIDRADAQTLSVNSLGETIKSAKAVFQNQKENQGGLSIIYSTGKELLKTDLSYSKVKKVIALEEQGYLYMKEAQNNSLTKKEYYKHVKEDLFLITPGINQMSDASKENLKKRISSLTIEEIKFFEKKALELPKPDDKNYESEVKNYLSNFKKLTEEEPEINFDKSRELPSMNIKSSKVKDEFVYPDGDELIKFEEVFAYERETAFNKDKIAKYNAAQTMLQLASYNTDKVKKIHSYLDTAVNNPRGDWQAGDYAKLDMSLKLALEEQFGKDEDAQKTGIKKMLGKDDFNNNLDLAKAFLSKIDENYEASMQGRTVEDYSEDYAKAYVDAFGRKNSEQLARAYEADNESITDRVSGVAQGGGLTLMLVGGALCLIPTGITQVVGSGMVSGGGKLALGGMIAQTGLKAVNEASRGSGMSADARDEIIKEGLVNLASFAVGAGAGYKGAKVGAGMLAKGSSKFAAMAAERGVDVTLSIAGDLIITGDLNLEGNTLGQITALVTGIKTGKSINKHLSGTLNERTIKPAFDNVVSKNKDFSLKLSNKTTEAEMTSFTQAVHNSGNDSKVFKVPEMHDLMMNDSSSPEISGIKLNLKDRVKGIFKKEKNPFGLLGAKQMEYVFNHNAQPRVQEQIGKAFDAVIEHTEKTAKLSDAPINKLDFYEPVTLPDGTKLSINHIKANGNDKLKNCPEEVISVVDAEGNHSFLIANSPENIARANKLKDLMSRIEQPEHLKSVSKVETDISKVQFITKNPKGKNVLTPEGEKIIRMKAEEIHNAAKEAQDGILADMKKAGLIGDEYTVSHRPKSVQSLFDKMKNEMIRDDAPASFETAVKSVRDAVGVRTLLGNLDYKNYPEIAQMLKTDPEKAYKMAAEKQSEIMVDNISQLIKAQAEGNSPIAAMRLTNYSGKDGLPYFSDAQVAYLRDLALENKINLQIKDETTKIRASGYTALQMNFVTKDGFVYEWQLRGKELDLFANAEHIPYDLRENKDITSGNPKLKELYAPIIEAVKMTDAEYAKYNDYLTDHYKYLRKKELGFPAEPPRLEDYGNFDKRLSADNLEIVHELSEKIKKGEDVSKEIKEFEEHLMDVPAWAERKTPQAGEFIPYNNTSKEKMNTLKKYLGDEIAPDLIKNKLFNKLDIDTDRIDVLVKRCEILKDKADLNSLIAIKELAEMSDDKFASILKLVNSETDKIDGDAFADVLMAQGAITVIDKNIPLVRNSYSDELVNKLEFVNEKIQTRLLRGSHDEVVKNSEVYADIVLKMQNKVEDPNILKTIDDCLDKLVYADNMTYSLKKLNTLLDVVNCADGKYGNIDGELYSAYKKLMQTDVKKAKKQNILSNKSDIKEKVRENFVNKLNTDDRMAVNFNQDLKFEPLKKFINEFNTSDNPMCDYLYKKYYTASLPEKVKMKCEAISDEFNSKIFLIDSKDYSAANEIYTEYKLWYEAGKGDVKYPPTLDTSVLYENFIDTNTAGSYSPGTERIKLKNHNNISYALRHEMLHLNDKLNCEDFGQFGPNKEYNFSEKGKILKEKKWFREEFLKGGISEYHVDYAYTDRAEFVAVASEGDFTKYSPEFKKVLVDLGMPEWVLSMSKNSIEQRVKSQYKTPEQISKYENFVRMSRNHARLLEELELNPEKLDAFNEIVYSYNGDIGFAVGTEMLNDIKSCETDKLNALAKYAKLRGDKQAYNLKNLSALSAEQLDVLYPLLAHKSSNGKLSLYDKRFHIEKLSKEIDKEKTSVLLDYLKIEDKEGNSVYDMIYNLSKYDTQILNNNLELANIKDKFGDYPFANSIKYFINLNDVEKSKILMKYIEIKDSAQDLPEYHFLLPELQKLPNDRLENILPFAKIKNTFGDYEYKYRFDAISNIETEKLPSLYKLVTMQENNEFPYQLWTEELGAYSVDEIGLMVKNAKIKDENGNERLRSYFELIDLLNDNENK